MENFKPQKSFDHPCQFPLLSFQEAYMVLINSLSYKDNEVYLNGHFYGMDIPLK